MKTVIIVLLLALAGYFGWQYLSSTQRGDQPMAPTPKPQPTNQAMLESPKGVTVTAQPVNYYQDVTGYSAAPSEPGQYPGVVMIHEWWGLNDHIKAMAETLASQGYQVLAVDLFQGQVADTPDQARAQVSSLDQDKAIQNLQAAVNYLRQNQASRIASLGWCFGGGQSLQLSLSDADLSGTIIYYGQLVTDQDQLASIDNPVLGIFGAEDNSIPVNQVNQFQAALDQLEVDNSITIYPEVGHAFANPSGENYAPGPTQDAWNQTLQFLEANLKTPITKSG